ncbi:MAG: hypothetical protein LBV79_08105, partial [Candidatus Adiutrix sp.]|nr:hypothetical protein [Candidatus Adiutrix sp.]
LAYYRVFDRLHEIYNSLPVAETAVPEIRPRPYTHTFLNLGTIIWRQLDNPKDRLNRIRADRAFDFATLLFKIVVCVNILQGIQIWRRRTKILPFACAANVVMMAVLYSASAYFSHNGFSLYLNPALPFFSFYCFLGAMLYPRYREHEKLKASAHTAL